MMTGVQSSEIIVTQEMWDFVIARIETLESQFGEKGELVTTHQLPARQGKIKPTRGSRVAEDWLPGPTSVGRIKDEFPWMSRDQMAAEHRKFIDYWMSKAGKDAVKIDWDRTWCNWMRTAAERMPRVSGRLSTVDQKITDLQAMKEQP